MSDRTKPHCLRCRDRKMIADDLPFCLDCELAFNNLIESASVQALAALLSNPKYLEIWGSKPPIMVADAHACSLVSLIRSKYAPDASRKSGN